MPNEIESSIPTSLEQPAPLTEITHSTKEKQPLFRRMHRLNPLNAMRQRREASSMQETQSKLKTETLSPEAPVFPHIQVAKDQVEKQITDPLHRQTINEVLDTINEQASSNQKSHESKNHKGVRIPYTTISINELVEQHVSPQEQIQLQQSPKGRDVWRIEIGGFALPPGGYPMIHGDRDINDAISAIPQIEGPLQRNQQGESDSIPNITEVIIGSPNTPAGGRITAEYLISKLGFNPASEMGFDVDAHGYAEILRPLLSQNPDALRDARIVLHSVSMGAEPAERTAKLLLREFPQLAGQVQVLRDNPVINRISPNELQNWMQRIQIGMGYIGQGIVESKTNEKLQSVMELEKTFMPQVKEYLDQIQQGKIDESHPKIQTLLQNIGAVVDLLNLMKGSPQHLDADRVPTENNKSDWQYRTYDRIGWKDPTTFSLKRTAKLALRKILPSRKNPKIVASNEHNGISFMMDSAHIPNYYRVQKWNEIINNFCKWKPKAATNAA